MVSADRGHTRLVDGFELSYGYKTPGQFAKARRGVTQELLPIVHDPDKYRQVFTLAFGLWLDHDWRKVGWNSDRPAENYFSPETLASTVHAALQVADEYIWIYSETPRWWSAEGQPVKLPAEYGSALLRAKGIAKTDRGGPP